MKRVVEGAIMRAVEPSHHAASRRGDVSRVFQGTDLE
jgi:hypothetical protein